MSGDSSDSKRRTVSSDWYPTGEPDWDELVRARTQYLLQLGRLFSPTYNPVPLLRAALASGSPGRQVAIQELQGMAEHRPDLIRALTPELSLFQPPTSQTALPAPPATAWPPPAGVGVRARLRARPGVV